MPAYFVTLEGPEGSGKSTQANMLADALMKRGVKIKLTREPGGDPVSEKIRNILLHGADDEITYRTELFLYLAARAQHTEKVIRPSLENGITVICARYIDSTTAYQGYGSGFDLELIRRLNDFATGGLKPNLTLLLDIDVETGLRRQRTWNRIERKSVEYHQRVREGFLEEARLHPDRIVVIDSSRDIKTVHDEIMKHIAKKLGLPI